MSSEVIKASTLFSRRTLLHLWPCTTELLHISSSRRSQKSINVSRDQGQIVRSGFSEANFAIFPSVENLRCGNCYCRWKWNIRWRGNPPCRCTCASYVSPISASKSIEHSQSFLCRRRNRQRLASMSIKTSRITAAKYIFCFLVTTACEIRLKIELNNKKNPPKLRRHNVGLMNMNSRVQGSFHLSLSLHLLSHRKKLCFKQPEKKRERTRRSL